MAYKYGTKAAGNCAKAVGVGLPISFKQSLMICNAIRGLSIDRAKRVLEDAIDLKQPIRFTRFTNGLGHKKGMAAGRYPVKACAHILELVRSAEANAQFKGLSANLLVKHVAAQQGPGIMRYGRRAMQAKRTHVEIIVEEVKKEKKPATPAKAESKPAKQTPKEVPAVKAETPEKVAKEKKE